MRTWGYRIASLVILGLFGWSWYAAYSGMGLPSTAAASAQRARTKSARVGSYGGRYYSSGGPRFGK